MRPTSARLFGRLLRIALMGMLIATVMSARAYADDGGAKYKTLADFKGSTVGMVSGTSFDELIEKNEVLRGDVDAIFQNSEVDGITSLLVGKCDAFATD
ncbi:MAG: hypothetical protein IKG22_02475 [Atopobiaceae bacterium]|nr:hypothetical protein [Atopobiaceae bacterium]